MITEADEKLYRLKPLPVVPFVGLEESRRMNADYEAGRVAYRAVNPIIENVEPGDPGFAALQPTKGNS